MKLKMRSRMGVLSGILVVSLTIIGMQKWNQYEKTRPSRELEQRITQLLNEAKLNPNFARKSSHPVASLNVAPKLDESVIDNPEESDESPKRPIMPAA